MEEFQSVDFHRLVQELGYEGTEVLGVRISDKIQKKVYKSSDHLLSYVTN